ncbi:MAG: hypothetical protein PHU23_16170 [Dehalococcoidales bacterium]|jgi:hypothetical protein|nr:hypothetical protein [Dehalococcoidales bacterium]MDD5703569.1 hypothetical protein [Dehalococcoidales bacterium]
MPVTIDIPAKTPVKPTVKPTPRVAPEPQISPFPPEKLCPEQTKRITQ